MMKYFSFFGVIFFVGKSDSYAKLFLRHNSKKTEFSIQTLGIRRIQDEAKSRSNSVVKFF